MPGLKFKPLSRAQFNRLSNQRKRIMIAEDALATLRTKTAFRMGTGVYLEGPSLTKEQAAITDFDKVLALPGIRKHCEVCAKGALFLTHVKLFDQVKSRKVVSSRHMIRAFQDTVCSPLLQYFSREQLSNIERAFESWDTESSPWFDAYPDAKARFAAICRNIIRNKGEFDFYEVRPLAKKEKKKSK